MFHTSLELTQGIYCFLYINVQLMRMVRPLLVLYVITLCAI